MPLPGSKGKNKVKGKTVVSSTTTASGVQIAQPAGIDHDMSDFGMSVPTGGTVKRRRSSDGDSVVPVERALPRNPVVAKFFSGSDSRFADSPAPAVRRRVDSTDKGDIKKGGESNTMTGTVLHPIGSVNSPQGHAVDTGSPVVHAPLSAHSEGVVLVDSSHGGAVHVASGTSVLGSKFRTHNTKEATADGVTSPLPTPTSALASMVTSDSPSVPSINSSSENNSMPLDYTRTQPTTSLARGGSSLRSDDPFGYLSSGPSSRRPEREYIQQPIYRPPPQFALPSGSYSMASPSSTAGNTMRGFGMPAHMSAVDPFSHAQTAQAMSGQPTFPHFMPSVCDRIS